MKKLLVIIILFLGCSKEDNSDLIAQFEQQVSNLSSQITGLNNQVSDLTNQLSNIQTENNDLTIIINSLNELVEVQSSQISELENIQSLYTDLLEEYNSLVESNSNVSIVSLSTQNSLLYEQINALETEIENLNELIAALLIELAAAQNTTTSPTAVSSETTASSGTASSTTETSTNSENTGESESSVQYQLTVNTDDKGSVSSTGGTYNSGSSVSVSATANSGCVFVNWTDSNGNVLSTNTTYSFNINNDITISANFIEIPKTYVPDDAFEQILIDLGYDDVLDDYVYTNDINNSSVYSLTLNYNANLVDLTGLEDFTYLTYLNIHGGFTSFSIPETLTSLNTLYIGRTPNLTSLSLSSTLLDQLGFTQPTGIGSTIDTSNLPNLRHYYDNNMSQETGITTLDFSNNPELLDLNIHHSQVSSLNISANNKLNAVLVYNTPLSGVFDISHLPITADVRIQNTQITCLKVRQEQLDKMEELLASNSGGSAGTVGMWRLNDATVSLTCD